MTDTRRLFADFDPALVLADFARLLGRLDAQDASHAAVIYRDTLKAAGLEAVRLRLAPEVLSQAAAERQIEELASSVPGWLRRRSSLELHPMPHRGKTDEPPLHGQWGTAEIGWELRLVEPRCWSLVEMQEVAAGAEGDAVLARTIGVYGIRGVRRLLYRVYFAAGPDRPGELCRVGARLCGIELAKEI